MIRQHAARRTGPSGRAVTAATLGFLGVVGLGLGLGSASGVTLGANTLGAGVATSAPCQGAAPITASFTTTWQASSIRYRATRVRLSGISDACIGRSYKFRVVTNTGVGYLSPDETGTVTSDSTGDVQITTTPVTEIVRIELVIS